MVNSVKNDLTSVVAQSWSEHCSGHIALELALSGGLDSVVLLHVLTRLREALGLTISAVHVHHGLLPEADAWVGFCRQLCAAWQLDLRVVYASVDVESGLGVEAAARAARYQAFSGSLKPVVALAHHQDDQVETVLLALLRGGGIRALAAMPACRALSPGIALWRPLLSVPRAQLLAYAQAHQLDYLQDPSNEDVRYLRNWVRQQWLPPLQQRLPHYARHIETSLSLLQSSLRVVDEVRDADWAATAANGYLDCLVWQRLSPARQEQILLQFATVHQLGRPRPAALRAFQAALNAAPERTHTWLLPQGRALACRGRLWPWSDAHHQYLKRILAQNLLAYNMNPVDGEPGLVWQRAEQGLPESVLNAGWRVRAVHKSDTLAGVNRGKNIVKWLQGLGVPAVVRQQWPVIVNQADECVAVVGLQAAAKLAVAQGWLPVCPVLTPFCVEPK